MKRYDILFLSISIAANLFGMQEELKHHDTSLSSVDLRKLVIAVQQLTYPEMTGQDHRELKRAQLYCACEEGNEESGLMFLEQGVDPSKPHVLYRSTPLHHAIRQGSFRLCTGILKNRAIAFMPSYEKDSYTRILTALCCLSLGKEVPSLPKDCCMKILGCSYELLLDIIKIISGDQTRSLSERLEVARKVLGSDTLFNVLATYCSPHFAAFFAIKGKRDTHFAAEYAKLQAGEQKFENDLAYEMVEHRPSIYTQLLKGEVVTHEQHQLIDTTLGASRNAIYQLLRSDTFNERLPGLLSNWLRE